MQVVTSIIQFIIFVLGLVFGKRSKQKTAEDRLKDNPTKDAREAAEEEAAAKYGK